MKKTSLFVAASIMVLAVIVAVVGVTAAWFGDIREYRDTVEVSSADPENSAIIVPDSTSGLPTGDAAVLAPARIKRGYILNDVDGSGNYDDIAINPSTNFGAGNSAIEKPAVPVTVTFDFVYNGAPSNPDGMTTKMKIELASITLQNPLKEVDMNGDDKITDEDRALFAATLTNYRDEFGIEMTVVTTDSEVMLFTNPTTSNKYYTEKTRVVGDGDEATTETYYELNLITVNPDNPFEITFDMIPVVNTLEATIYFLHVDEQTPPELIAAQLFLNFKVTFLTGNTNGNNNEN